MGVRTAWIVQWQNEEGEWINMSLPAGDCKVKPVQVTRNNGSRQRGYLSLRSAQRALQNRKRESRAAGYNSRFRTRRVLDYGTEYPSTEHAA